MQAKSVSAMADLDSGTRVHIQALAEAASTGPGLMCNQRIMHVGVCKPHSSTVVTTTFHGYQGGLYEVGNVKLFDANGNDVRSKSVRHTVFVSAPP